MIQYAALALMLEQLTGYRAVAYYHTISDAHIYTDQVDAVRAMLATEPRPLPTVTLNEAGRAVTDIHDFRAEHFELADYHPNPAIGAIPSRPERPAQRWQSTERERSSEAGQGSHEAVRRLAGEQPVRRQRRAGKPRPRCCPRSACRAACSRTPPTSTSASSRTTSKIETTVNALRTLGFKVVLTSGSFDIIHEGHSMYLEAARQFGDFLIVGLDSDEKIRRPQGREPARSSRRWNGSAWSPTSAAWAWSRSSTPITPSGR